MDFIRKPPDWLMQPMPDGVQEFLNNGGWLGILGVGALVVLLVLWAFASKFLGLFKPRPKKPVEKNLVEDLSSFQRLPPSTGDRRLLVEGVPVRLRLVVAAPAGVATRINSEAIIKLLDSVLPGLGDIAAHDRPRITIWPAQLSYEGFANTFHRSTPVPEGEDDPTPWVLLAGRALIGKHQVNLGLGLQALKAHTIGRRTLKAHEWDSVLRVRVRD
jgi:hypothetical protein